MLIAGQYQYEEMDNSSSSDEILLWSLPSLSLIYRVYSIAGHCIVFLFRLVSLPFFTRIFILPLRF